MYNYSCLTGYETSDSLTTQCLSDGSLSLATPPTCNSECWFCRYLFYYRWIGQFFSRLSELTVIGLKKLWSSSCFCILEISCGMPPEGTNTVAVPQDNLLYEQTYNYSCLTGYETSDSITTQCLSDGSWSLATSPICSSKCYFCGYFICLFYLNCAVHLFSL